MRISCHAAFFFFQLGSPDFEQSSYSLDNAISPQRLGEAYGWIKRSADQGFRPANYTLTLFTGKVQASGQPVAGSP